MAWNVSWEAETQYQARVCSDRCNGTIKVNAVPEERCAQCLPCTCQPSCRLEGTCCPDVDQPWPPAPASFNRSSCFNAPVGRRMMTPSVIFVHRCDPAFLTDHPTYDLCAPPDTLPKRPDTHIPVTSLTTKVTYVNQHCAVCNYDNDSVVEWRMVCAHNQFLYNVTTDDEYNERGLQLSDVCGARPVLNHTDITKDDYHKCRPEYHDVSSLVTRCNVTGQWLPAENEDGESVQRACEQPSEPSLAARISFRHFLNLFAPHTFANVFCARCNGFYVDATFCFVNEEVFDSNDHVNGIGIRTGMELLNYDAQGDVTTSLSNTCPEHDQWRHPQVGASHKLGGE